MFRKKFLKITNDIFPLNINSITGLFQKKQVYRLYTFRSASILKLVLILNVVTFIYLFIVYVGVYAMAFVRRSEDNL